MQTCNTCKVEKPWSEYHRDGTRATGYRVMCKPCVKAYGAARYSSRSDEFKEWRKSYYAENRQAIIERQAVYYSENRDEILAKVREKRAADPQRFRDQHRQWLYGITREGFDALLAQQGGGCAICKAAEPGGVGEWHVDHDHGCCPGRRACGNCNRGLLCSTCNTMLGHAKDDPQLLADAAIYLVRYAGLLDDDPRTDSNGNSDHQAAGV